MSPLVENRGDQGGSHVHSCRRRRYIARVHSSEDRAHRHRCPERRLRRELACRRGDRNDLRSRSARPRHRGRSHLGQTLFRGIATDFAAMADRPTRSRLQWARRSSRRPMATPSRTRTSRRSSRPRASGTSSSKRCAVRWMNPVDDTTADSPPRIRRHLGLGRPHDRGPQ